MGLPEEIIFESHTVLLDLKTARSEICMHDSVDMKVLRVAGNESIRI
jgi:hypothetical protein